MKIKPVSLNDVDTHTNRLKNNKGVTMITLVVTIMIMLMLSITLVASLTSTIELNKYNKVKEDIIQLNNAIGQYYLNSDGVLPADTSYYYDISRIPAKDINPNDSGNYYLIEASLLGVKLNYGEGNKKKIYNTDDVYLLNEKSLTVYYLAGIVLNGERHYTITDTWENGGFAEDYYSEAELPIISTVTLESNGSSKNRATTGDVVTLTINTNYTLTQQPTVKILGHNVTVSWSGNIGVAKYEITSSDNLDNWSIIPIEIYNYSANNREGDKITKVTFGTGVIYYKTGN